MKSCNIHSSNLCCSHVEDYNFFSHPENVATTVVDAAVGELLRLETRDLFIQVNEFICNLKLLSRLLNSMTDFK
jgi:hypothetical protein